MVKEDSYDSTFRGDGGTTGAMFGYQSEGELAKFYHEDGLARRIVDVVPEEMVSCGFTINGLDDDAEFKSVWDGYKLDQHITDALAWSRLYGGSAVVAIINDGRMLTAQATLGAKLESVRVYDKDSVQVKKRDTNARSVRYGQPVIFTIQSDYGKPYDVHYTRMHIIDGERVTNAKRKERNGWGASVLNRRLVEAILDYNECEKLATQLLNRKQQAVWKVKGLADMCDDADGLAAARLRLAQVSDNSGVGKPVGIDANDEEYDVLNSDISGVDTFLDKKLDRIVTLSGIHEIILKNKNTGGVSASQNTALETYYKLVDRKRKEDYQPLLEFLLPFVVDEQEFDIVFNPLSMPSEKDQATTSKTRVEAINMALAEQLIGVSEGRNTLRALCPEFKIEDGDTVKDPRIDVATPNEPEPNAKERLSDES